MVYSQEEADEESKALYAKRSAAVLAAFGASGAEVPSRVIPLELEGASVCEEGLKVVLEVSLAPRGLHFEHFLRFPRFLAACYECAQTECG